MFKAFQSNAILTMGGKYNHFYLVNLQFLGFRLHGWQKQPDQKTVHSMLDRTINFVLGGKVFKTLGTGRTDAMVSAESAYFELFLKEDIEVEEFFQEVNKNLPPDLRIASIKAVDEKFNVMQDVEFKEYHYYFSFGEKMHPFAAPLIAGFTEDLDLDLMKKGAALYEGEHDFINYCHYPKEGTITTRKILRSAIIQNPAFHASFFPSNLYQFSVRAKGFMRYQVRLMMGGLVRLGKHQISLEQLEESLRADSELSFVKFSAPASGLHLVDVSFKKQ